MGNGVLYPFISFQPVLMDNSINQSASFKKVMYSVMGDSDL